MTISAGPKTAACATAFALANGPALFVNEAIVRPFISNWSYGKSASATTVLPLMDSMVRGSVMGVFCWLMYVAKRVVPEVAFAGFSHENLRFIVLALAGVRRFNG